MVQHKGNSDSHSMRMNEEEEAHKKRRKKQIKTENVVNNSYCCGNMLVCAYLMRVYSVVFSSHMRYVHINGIISLQSTKTNKTTKTQKLLLFQDRQLVRSKNLYFIYVNPSCCC